MDGTIQRGPKLPEFMQGIVIGGPANGMILKKLRTDATVIKLGRPDYVKPLTTSARNVDPEIEMEEGTYNVCALHLPNAENKLVMFGLVIEEGQNPVWAISELVKGFAQHVIDQIRTENLNS